MEQERTIGSLWRTAVARHGGAGTAYLVREGAEWKPVDRATADERIDSLAHGFLARGVRKGDTIGLFGRTLLEWVLVDFALARLGAVTAPIYHTSSTADATHILQNSDAAIVVCEGEDERGKIDRGSLPAVRDVLTFADLAEVEAEGRAHRETSPDAVAEAEAAVAEGDVYTFIYTSGTTGPPKGCRITHLNYFAMVESVVSVRELDLERGGDVILLFLPLAHNFGRLTHLFGARVGAAVALEPDPYRVAEALQDVRPTIMPSVPRIYEKIHGTVSGVFAEATGVRRKLIDWSLRVGEEVSARRLQGQPVSGGLALRHHLADRLVYAKVKARLGGRLRLAISGGAPLAKEIGEFFDRLDIPILEGYGLTEETSAATVNRPGRTRYGTVGLALPGIELRLADDGELLVRGPTVFDGYHKDPAATAAAFDEEGWLRSGDIAQIDDDGFVTITDRKKDIIVTAGGKNIAPQNLENDLKLSRWISQALVIGDRRPYPAALITLDPAEIVPWAREQGLGEDVEALATEPRVVELVQQAVDAVNASRARFEQVKRFAILPRDFSMADGEITPTLKLRRQVCTSRFAEEIESLYALSPGSDATSDH